MSSDQERILFLEEENTQLPKIISKLENTIIVLTKRIDYLEEELRKTILNKNSSNGSKPPSSDFSKPKINQGFREKIRPLKADCRMLKTIFLAVIV